MKYTRTKNRGMSNPEHDYYLPQEIYKKTFKMLKDATYREIDENDPMYAISKVLDKVAGEATLTRAALFESLFAHRPYTQLAYKPDVSKATFYRLRQQCIYLLYKELRERGEIE